MLRDAVRERFYFSTTRNGRLSDQHNEVDRDLNWQMSLKSVTPCPNSTIMLIFFLIKSSSQRTVRQNTFRNEIMRHYNKYCRYQKGCLEEFSKFVHWTKLWRQLKLRHMLYVWSKLQALSLLHQKFTWPPYWFVNLKVTNCRSTECWPLMSLWFYLVHVTYLRKE